MPPSRFGASKFRNAVPSIPGRENWYRTHLPSASSSNTTSSSTSTFSSEVKTSRRWIITASTSGDISWRGYAGSGVGSVKIGTIGDWDISGLEDETLVTGGTDGSITVYQLPGSPSEQPTLLHTFSAGSAVTSLSLHPTTSSILLVATTQTPLVVYDISTAPSEPTITLKVEEPKGIWSCAWSPDGTRVAAIGRSGKCYIFDPRQSSAPAISKPLTSIQPLRPARIQWIDDKIFLTGTDRSRNRLYTLLSSSDLSAAFVQNVDTNLSPLLSVVDQERKIIYVSGRGDMSVRQVELGGVTGFQETIHALPHPLASTSITLAHPTVLEVMQAEIGRLLLPVVDKDGDTILPLGIKVPRRQLIDYHEDLYPDITGTIPEQTTAEWFSGSDGKPLPFTLDPSRRSTWESKLSATTKTLDTASEAQPIESKTVISEVEPRKTPLIEVAANPKSQEVPDNAIVQESQNTVSDEDASGQPQIETASASSQHQPGPEPVQAEPTGSAEARRFSDKEAAEDKKSQPALTSASTSANPIAASPALLAPPNSSKPASSRYNPGWSRKFLAGVSPLNPTYDSLPPLSSLHQDSLIFKISPHLAFFPVQGPGGRLGVHPLKKKGRMSTGGEGYLSGGVEIADFDVEPFSSPGGSVRVAVAGEDGLIRVWTVGEDGIKGVGPEAETVSKGDGVDKIATVAFHPTARNLLTVLSNDQGSCTIRLFDIEAGQEVKKYPLDLDGAFNMIWSPLGDRVALSSKDGKIVVLDPRKRESILSGSAHNSPRSIQIAWIDDTHLVSVGFAKGSQRRINLYSIDTGTINTKSSILIDVSPSVLFPRYDPDTSILYVWGKGERQIQAYEVRPDHPNEPISKLPSFTAGSPQLGVSFVPKRMVDIKKVEVGRVLRLTARSIEEVSFSIPRNKPEFFQDDIYVDTLDLETSSTTAQDWLDGREDIAGARYISLKPDGMTPLSEAPKTDTAAKKKFVPAVDVKAEQAKKQKEMDDLFKKAKMDESSDEDDEPKRTGLAPPDDDW